MITALMLAVTAIGSSEEEYLVSPMLLYMVSISFKRCVHVVTDTKIQNSIYLVVALGAAD